MPARIAPRRHHLPGLGQLEHPGQDPDRVVGRIRHVAQRVMQRRDVLGGDFLKFLVPEGGKDVVPQREPVAVCRVRPAPGLDMVLEPACRQIGDGGRGRGPWVLAPLDAVDDLGRLAPARIHRLGAHPPERHPLQAGRTPGLDDVELAPGGVDAHAEACGVAVPEDRVLAVGAEPVHDTLGQSEGAALGHGLSPGGVDRSKMPVIKPRPPDIEFVAVYGPAVSAIQGAGSRWPRKNPIYRSDLCKSRRYSSRRVVA